MSFIGFALLRTSEVKDGPIVITPPQIQQVYRESSGVTVGDEHVAMADYTLIL